MSLMDDFNRNLLLGIRSGWVKWLTLLLTLIFYGVIFGLIEPIIGLPLAVLMILPVTTAGWLFGVWGGLIIGILSLPVNIFLVTLAGETNLASVIGGGGLFWHAGVLFVGVVTGRLKDLGDKSKQTEKSLRISEELLRKEKAIMESRVEERTKELRREQKALKEAKEQTDLGYIQLQRERAKLAVSIDNLPIGFVLTGPKEGILAINEKVKEILDLEQVSKVSEIEKKLLGSLNLHKALEKAKLTRHQYEFGEVLLEGKFLRIFLNPITMPHDHREFIGTAVLIEDITEAKLLERSKDEFFAVAAHDMRTPLPAIRGNAAMIKQYFPFQLKDPSLREMVSDIHESSVRLIGLVNDYLDVVKFEQKKTKLHKETFDLLDLIKETIRQLENTAGSKGLYLRLEKEGIQLPLVSADRNRTSQVLFNLIGNAIKFTETGGVKVTVKKENGSLAVRVIDTGSGISKPDQRLLFRRFQQVGEKILTRNTITGTGLGLYSSKLLVEAMGGKIYLESSQVG